MAISDAEPKIRSRFPLIRFLQAYMPLSILRWLLKLSVRHTRLEAGVQRQQVLADGVACEWIIPPGAPEDRVLLYLHGGGFVLGITHLHLHMVAYLANKMALRALMVDYRLAPEYPYPAPLEDCLAAYRWLLKQGIPAQNIMLAGDSAGGNLVITSVMKLRDDDDPLPAAVACLSPVADLSNNTPQPQGFKDPLVPPRASKLYRNSYVGHNDSHNPFITPIFGDLHGLPPLLVHAGEDELLRQDAIRITDLAKSAGLDVRLEIYPRMWHVWQLYLNLPQAIQSLDNIASFLCAHLPVVASPSKLA
jgi:monoterpene epsilon-lactone hydrolase